MKNVNNKRCLYNLCKKNMKANWRRNVLLMCAILLTTIMMTTLFTIGGSVMISYQNNTFYQVGTSSMAGFKFMTEEEYEKLEEDSKVSNLSYNVYVGTAANDELYEDYSEVRYTTPMNANVSFCMPTTGKLPESGNEVATCTKVLDDLGIKHQVGQMVHLKIDNGQTVYEGDFVLSGFWDKPADILVNQIFVSKDFQEYFSPTWKTASEKKTLLEQGIYSGCVNSDFDFWTTFNLEKQMSDLKERLGFGSDVNDGVNWVYLGSTVDATSVAMVAIILLLIISSGYLIIFNIFYIAVSSEVQYYGLLKTIGLTNKQLKKMIVLQADILSLIGIPTGLVVGYFVSVVLFPMIADSMMSIQGIVYPDVRIFLLSALFSWITVRISCRKPGKVISRISPVEAVRYSEYNGENLSAKRKSRKVTPWSMAQENLKRNFKKTIVVVMSLALSIILINATVSVTEGFDVNKYLSGSINSDFMVTDASVENLSDLNDNYEGVDQGTMDYLSSLDGVTEVGQVYMSPTVQSMDDFLYERVLEFYKNHTNDFIEMEKDYYDDLVYNQKTISVKLFGIDKLPFDEMHFYDGETDWEKFKSGDYVIVSRPDMYEAQDYTSFYHVGETAAVEFPDGSTKEYKVLAIGELPYPMGPEYSNSLGFDFILPSDEYLAHVPNASGAMKFFMNVDETKSDDIEAEVQKYCEVDVPELAYTSRAYYRKDFDNMIKTYLLVGGVLSFILGLIGVLNWINLTVTSINERRMELQTLHAVGMTNHQIKKMLVGESLYRVGLTSIFVLTVGWLINYLLIMLLAGGMWMFEYKFVIWPMLLCIPIYLAIGVIIPVAIRRE